MRCVYSSEKDEGLPFNNNILDFNILGGDGENVLHVAAFSKHMWKDVGISIKDLSNSQSTRFPYR